ncbi:MAG TPA: nucleotidyltransferase family protein [Steroidobacteraceae bacterium]
MTGTGPHPSYASLRSIQRALVATTELLATELGRPGDVAPRWSAFEWRVARAVAAIHGISPLLSEKLRWQGAPGWQRFLREQRAHTAARHLRSLGLLQQIDAAGRHAGVAALALKGPELFSRGLYARGQRPMADIDLLIHRDDARGATRMLESIGFQEMLATPRHRIFVPTQPRVPAGLGEHADNDLKVEVHERITEALPIAAADITAEVFPSQPVAGLNRYPSRAALMSHLTLHAAGAMRARALRMLHLHDLALLSAGMSAADWQEFLERRAQDAGHRWALPPLVLTGRYYAAVIPAEVIAALALRCPKLLKAISRRRTLTAVSLSHLWIDAFPGIEWSRSTSEAVRYVATRICPDAKMLELRREVTEAHVPAAATEWNRLSQGRRVLRWLWSRQPRADTLHAVRLALESR